MLSKGNVDFKIFVNFQFIIITVSWLVFIYKVNDSCLQIKNILGIHSKIWKKREIKRVREKRTVVSVRT